RDSTASRSAATWLAWETSHSNGADGSPNDRARSAGLAAAMSTSAKRAPRSWNAHAKVRPMSLLAPVRTTTRLLISNSGSDMYASYREYNIANWRAEQEASLWPRLPQVAWYSYR